MKTTQQKNNKKTKTIKTAVEKKDEKHELTLAEKAKQRALAKKKERQEEDASEDKAPKGDGVSLAELESRKAREIKLAHLTPDERADLRKYGVVFVEDKDPDDAKKTIVTTILRGEGKDLYELYLEDAEQAAMFGAALRTWIKYHVHKALARAKERAEEATKSHKKAA